MFGFWRSEPVIARYMYSKTHTHTHTHTHTKHTHTNLKYSQKIPHKQTSCIGYNFCHACVLTNIEKVKRFLPLKKWKPELKHDKCICVHGSDV